MKLVGGLFLLIATSAVAQDVALSTASTPTIPEFVRQPAAFVPKGWKIVAIKSGDLNRDKRADVVVLLRKADPASVRPRPDSIYKQDDTNPYFLVVGFARANGFVLAATNHSLFPTETAPFHGDTPPGADTIEIARGVLTLSFEHIRSTEQFRFRWDGKAFALIGFDCRGVAGGTYIGLSANYLTLRAKVERGEISDDKTSSWTVRIRPAKRPTLDQIDWEYGWIGQDTDGDELSC